MQLREYGPAAWLVELDGGPERVLAWADAIRADEYIGAAVVDVVPGAATVLVTLHAGADRMAIAAQLEVLQPSSLPPADAGDVIEVAVTYDGDDLADVAEAIGSTIADVVARHTAPTYRCAFSGFAPGFAYLTGLDRALVLPRRETPRTRVPSGSVAIAAEYTAVYPSASPGGWHLIGRTDATLWDVGRDPPALIEPGSQVRFVSL